MLRNNVRNEIQIVKQNISCYNLKFKEVQKMNKNENAAVSGKITEGR